VPTRWAPMPAGNSSGRRVRPKNIQAAVVNPAFMTAGAASCAPEVSARRARGKRGQLAEVVEHGVVCINQPSEIAGKLLLGPEPAGRALGREPSQTACGRCSGRCTTLMGLTLIPRTGLARSRLGRCSARRRWCSMREYSRTLPGWDLNLGSHGPKQ